MKQTVAQLKAEAKALKIPRYSKMRKAELIEAIAAHKRPKIFMTGAEPGECWPLVRDFHYSGRMPGNIQHCYAVRGRGGLFGDFGEIQAVAIFAIPPTRWGEQVLELARLVRAPRCDVPLSKLVSFALRRLRTAGHALVVSFADRTQGHHGGVYQASGWNYSGCREKRMDGLLINGVFKPGRSCNSTFGTQSPDRLRMRLAHAKVEPHFDEGKHIYWKSLSVAGATRAKRLSLENLPYPKPKCGPSIGQAKSPSRKRGATPRGRSTFVLPPTLSPVQLGMLEAAE